MTAITVGSLPTLIGVPGRFVAVFTGVTVPAIWLTTYAVLPSLENAKAQGARPTLIGGPGVPVATLIGVTRLVP